DTDVPDNMILFETTAPGFVEGDFFVLRFDGFESLSTPYQFEILLQCNIEGGIAPEQADALLSSTARLSFGPGGIRSAGGMLRELEQLEISVDATTSVYRAVLVPRFWLTTLTRRSRAFNEMSIPDIIQAVFTEMRWSDGTDYELRLTGSYPVREYVVQYEESDFVFLSRWMERLGIFYFFEQTEEGDKLVITDSNSQLVGASDHNACVYNYHEQIDHAGAIHRFRRCNRMLPAKVHVRDYNWRTPSKPVVGNADVDTDHGFGLQAYYGDHFKDDGEGGTYATLRAELFQAEKERYTGRTSNYDFAPGYRFEVTGGPVGELDQEYVL